MHLGKRTILKSKLFKGLFKENSFHGFFFFGEKKGFKSENPWFYVMFKKSLKFTYFRT